MLLLLVRLDGRGEGVAAFAPPTVDSLGQVHVALLDDSAASYVIEVSTNLTNWSPVLTNTTTGGRLELTQAVDNAVRFYRARIDPAGGGNPPAVIPSPDPTQQTVGIVSPAGGALTLFSEAGVLYTLSFPSNAVSAPVQVSMTLVTNLVGQPFADTNWSAVVFEPSGLQLLSPALLTIQYFYASPPTNLASFCFSGDGTDFGLVPDQIFSNRVEFAVYHFSGVGAAPMTPTEYQNQRNRRVSSRLDNLNQEIAKELKPLQDSGQLPPPGQPLPADVASRLRSYLDGYIQNLLAYEARLMSDCEFLRGMLPKIRAAQTINGRYSLNSGLVDALSDLACRAGEKCARKIAAECKDGNTDVYRRVKEWEAFAFAPFFFCREVPDSELKDCLPVWYGTFNYYERSFTNQPSGKTGDFRLRGREYSLSLLGVVTKAKENPPTPFTRLYLTVDVTASLLGSSKMLDYSDFVDGCEASPGGPGAGKSTYHLETSAIGMTNVPFSMTLIQMNTPNAPVTVNLAPPTPLQIRGKGRLYVYKTDCYNRVVTNSTSTVSNSRLLDVPGFNDPHPVILVTTNSIKLQYRVQRYVDAADATVTGNWEVDLKRRPN